jgi:hypothetical protein
MCALDMCTLHGALGVRRCSSNACLQSARGREWKAEAPPRHHRGTSRATAGGAHPITPAPSLTTLAQVHPPSIDMSRSVLRPASPLPAGSGWNPRAGPQAALPQPGSKKPPKAEVEPAVRWQRKEDQRVAKRRAYQHLVNPERPGRSCNDVRPPHTTTMTTRHTPGALPPLASD